MKRSGIFLALLLSISICTGQTRQTQKTAPLTSGFKGSGFLDYSFNVKHPNAALEGTNEFSIRRLNLGYEHSFTRAVLAYAELEGKSGDLTAAGNYSVFIKQAYVEVKNMLPQMRLVMGLSPTPAVVTSERLWGYRMLQPLPLELYGFAPVVDNGIAAKGRIDPDGIVSYHVMVGNGTGTIGTETDKMKRLYGSVGFALGQGVLLEGYGDFENSGNGRFRATMKGLLGVEGNAYAIGLEGTLRINRHFISPTQDLTPYVVSLYGWVGAAEDFRLVYRGDFFDPDYNQSNIGIRTIEAMFGIDYLPAGDVHIVPNIMYTTYSSKNASGIAPNDGLTVRLTAGFAFSSIK